MTREGPLESDWKKFRKIVPELRERYLRERNSELDAILRDESLTPTDRFWAVSKRVDEIGAILRMCLNGHTRSKMMHYLLLMYRHQLLVDGDMEGFSEGVRERLRLLAEVDMGPSARTRSSGGGQQ